jgi:hypothetical protein
LSPPGFVSQPAKRLNRLGETYNREFSVLRSTTAVSVAEHSQTLVAESAYQRIAAVRRSVLFCGGLSRADERG